MTDYHIHIGQFNNKYYDAHEIFGLIESISNKTRITEIHFSSTSSCRDDVEFEKIEEEINYAQSFSSEKIIIKPYLWYVPKYINQKININSVTKNFDYCGIKLHPFAQHWDFSNDKHLSTLHNLFSWADENSRSVLIHCGTQESILPNRFEIFFNEYKNAKIILAHSNPIDITSQMVNKYKNVFCDTACLQKQSLIKLKQQVSDNSKILFGSDFPVSHYYKEALFYKKKSLEKQYLYNCNLLKLINKDLYV